MSDNNIDALIDAIQKSGIKELRPGQIVRLFRLFTVGTWLWLFALVGAVIGVPQLVTVYLSRETAPERPPTAIPIERTEAVRIGDSLRIQPPLVWDHAYALN